MIPIAQATMPTTRPRLMITLRMLRPPTSRCVLGAGCARRASCSDPRAQVSGSPLAGVGASLAVREQGRGLARDLELLVRGDDEDGDRGAVRRDDPSTAGG